MRAIGDDNHDYAFSSPLRPSARSSAGCIFMSWDSAMAKRLDSLLEQPRGLSNLDKVAVWVSHIAPDLSAAILRGRQELSPF